LNRGRNVPIADAHALASVDYIAGQLCRRVGDPEAGGWFDVNWRRWRRAHASGGRQRRDIAAERAIAQECRTTAVGRIGGGVHVGDVEAVVIYIVSGKHAIGHVIPGPPKLLDQVVAGEFVGFVDVERIAHRAHAEVALEGDTLFVADLFVKEMAQAADAYVVRNRQILSRVHRYALIVAVIDAVGIDERGLAAEVLIHVEMDRIAADLILAELLHLHALNRDFVEAIRDLVSPPQWRLAESLPAIVAVSLMLRL